MSVGRRGGSQRARQQQLAEWAGDSGAAATRPVRGRRSWQLRRSRLSQKDVIWVLEKLGTSLGAGIPLFRSLAMLQRMRDLDVVGERLAEIQQDVSDGRTLTQAMNRHQAEWGRTVIALVEAGEASGKLKENLARAAEMVVQRNRLRRRVTGALIYPSAVVLITVALVTLLLLVVVPRFKQIYDQLGSQLPVFTRFVIALSKGAPWFVLFAAAATAALVATVRRSRRDEQVAGRLDMVKTRIPLIGQLIEKSSVARVAQTFAGMLSSGVNVLTALDHARNVAGLRRHAKALEAARDAVSDGSSVAGALAQSGAFPDMLVQYVAVGEQSGKLAEMMERYAAGANEEVEETASNIIRLIEPLMMVMIGIVVGLFVLALYLPILTIGNQIQ